MSFGVGIGDIVFVAQLAKSTVAKCRSAPNDFNEASRVAESLYLILDGVEAEYRNNDSPLHRDERTRTDFAIHFKNCESALKPMAVYIEKFASLGGPKIRLMDRLLISKREIMELRGNLAFYTSRLSEFLQVIGLGSVGRVEKKVDDVKDYLPQLMFKLDQMSAEVRLIGEKESLLSDHPGDEKSVWKTFRTRLIQAGYNSSILREHEAALFLRIRELAKCGLLESEPSSRASSYLDPPEVETLVFQTPGNQACPNETDTDDDDGAISDGTITPRASTDNLTHQQSMASTQPISEFQHSHSQPLPSTPVKADYRIWRDRKGKAFAKAVFMQQTIDFIILRDSDGQELKVSATSLSEDDLTFVASLQTQDTTQNSPCEITLVEMNCQQVLSSIDEISTTIEDETIDLSRDRRPPPLIGRRSCPTVRIGKRTKIQTVWRYRVQSVLPQALKPSRLHRDLTDDTLPETAGRGDLAGVKRLLKSGYSIEATGPKSWTETISHGDTETTRRHSFPETTALYRAASAGHFQVAFFLLEQGANMDTRNGWDGSIGEPILFTVIRSGDENMVRLLLEYEAACKTSLLVACIYPNCRIVRLLLDFDADIDSSKRSGRTPLYIAVSNNYVDIVSLLLSEGALCDTTTSTGNTPIYLAASQGSRAIVKLLLQQGADYDLATHNGETPLYAAASQDYSGIVKLLLQEGARYDTVVRDGQSPLYKAAGRGYTKTVKYLLRYGADTSLGRGRHGETALYKAAWNDDIDVVELFLSHEADPNLENERKMSAYKGFQEQLLHGVAAGMGKAHSLMNHWGRTALHAAAFRGYEDIVSMLIDHGAELNIVGNDGQTAMYLAAHEHHRTIVQLLLKSGAQMQTERHDPVLALLDERNHSSTSSKAVSKRFDDPQTLSKIGTDEVLVGFIAKVTENFSKRRR